jgi:hypothetical protein
MKKSSKNSAALCFVTLALVAVSSAARAEYKCDAPASIDRRACEAAKQSPQALRSYIQRIKAIDSLYFFDYVNEAQARAWAQNEQGRQAARQRSVQAAPLIEQPGA